jgi:PIN like domain
MIKQQFKGFIGYTEDEFRELWKKAIFVVDTNILINFYKYKSKQSTKSLLDILKKLKESERLWIPHQVALEYFFNYEDNMYKQNEGYNLLGKELMKLKKEAERILSSVKSKHPYIMTDKFQFFIKNMEISNQRLQEQLEGEIENLPDSKIIQKDLLDLLEGLVGEPYSQKEIDQIEKEGKERYQHDIPPGFKDKDDKNKQEYRTYGDFRYQQLYGDLIVWYQIMDRAKKEGSQTPIILITEDRKEDWWEKDKGQIKRPHPQLIQEFLIKTNEEFYMYRTESFVKNVIDYLGANVTEEQYQEVTNEINNIRKAEDLKAGKVNIELEKNIDKILDYLTEEEIETYFQIRSEVKDLPFDSVTDYALLHKANEWAISIAIPRLEVEFKRSISHLKAINEEKGLIAKNVYNNIPKESNERVWWLLEELSALKEAISFYSSFPDGHL